jgi:hypothetical protein
MDKPAARSRGPLWLRAVHKLERTIGQPVEAALHSDTYFDLITEALRMKARRDRTLESVSRRLLHLLNLPAGSDIRRLREQIARLERQVVALSKDLDDAGAR